MENINKQQKLIYVLKIGNNIKDEGLYEFIFSEDHNNIDIEGWCWDLSPAIDNAEPPTEDFYDTVINLKTSTFDLFCLHEAVDREYLHGVYTIHALAYETEKEADNGYSDYDKMFNDEVEDNPLLVFHYGMSLERVEELLLTKKIILKNNEFVETSSIKLD